MVVDGVMYVSTAWSLVKAYDARSGTSAMGLRSAGAARTGRECLLRRGQSRRRGVESQDLSSVRTTGDSWRWMRRPASRFGARSRSIPRKPYTITQAPRVIKGRVIIGNSGGEYGPRGYISAYDAETGKLVVAVLHRSRRSVEAL